MEKMLAVERKTEPTSSSGNKSYQNEITKQSPKVRTTEYKKMIEILLNDPDSVTGEEFLLFQSAIGYRQAKRLLEEGKRRKGFAKVNGQKIQNTQIKTSSLEKAMALQRKSSSMQSSNSALLTSKKENHTGLPDNLKEGIQNLSGIDMSAVRVHCNSNKPEQVGALAYTKGTDIHVAPGQERHLPHEAWHVVQQAQERVQPTVQMRELGVNDDAGLEKEADIMGKEALEIGRPVSGDDKLHTKTGKASGIVTQLFKVQGIDNQNLPDNAKPVTLQEVESGYLRTMCISEIGEHALNQLPEKTLKLVQVFAPQRTLFSSAINAIEINIDDLSKKSPEKQCAELCHETFHFFDKMYIDLKDSPEAEQHRREAFKLRTQTASKQFGNIEEELAITGKIFEPEHQHFMHEQFDHSLFNENAVLRSFNLEERVSHSGEHDQNQVHAADEFKLEELKQDTETEEQMKIREKRRKAMMARLEKNKTGKR